MAHEIDVGAYHKMLLGTTLLENWQSCRLQLFGDIPGSLWTEVIGFPRPHQQLNADLLWLKRTSTENQISWIAAAQRLLCHSQADTAARQFLNAELDLLRGSGRTSMASRPEGRADPSPPALQHPRGTDVTPLKSRSDDVPRRTDIGLGVDVERLEGLRVEDDTTPAASPALEMDHDPEGMSDEERDADPGGRRNSGSASWFAIDADLDLLHEMLRALGEHSSEVAARAYSALVRMKASPHKAQLHLKQCQLASSPAIRCAGEQQRRGLVDLNALAEKPASYPIDREGIRELVLSAHPMSDGDMELRVMALTFAHELKELVSWRIVSNSGMVANHTH